MTAKSLRCALIAPTVFGVSYAPSNLCTGVLTTLTVSTRWLELTRVGGITMHRSFADSTDVSASRSTVRGKPPLPLPSGGTCVTSWHWQSSSAHRIVRITRTRGRPDSSRRFSYVCQYGFVLTSYHEYVGAAIVRARVARDPISARRAVLSDLAIEN